MKEILKITITNRGNIIDVAHMPISKKDKYMREWCSYAEIKDVDIVESRLKDYFLDIGFLTFNIKVIELYK